MKNNNKLKEWVLVKYNKKKILKMFDDMIDDIPNVPIHMSNNEYYDLYMNHEIESQIILSILNDIYNKNKKVNDVNKFIYFLVYYIKIIIPNFKIEDVNNFKLKKDENKK